MAARIRAAVQRARCGLVLLLAVQFAACYRVRRKMSTHSGDEREAEGTQAMALSLDDILALVRETVTVEAIRTAPASASSLPTGTPDNSAAGSSAPDEHS